MKIKKIRKLSFRFQFFFFWCHFLWSSVRNADHVQSGNNVKKRRTVRYFFFPLLSIQHWLHSGAGSKQTRPGSRVSPARPMCPDVKCLFDPVTSTRTHIENRQGDNKIKREKNKKTK